MIFVLHGVDELALQRRLQELKDEADGGTGMLATNLTTIEGRDAKAEEIIGPAMTPPFLSARRMVLVEGLLDRFEPRPPAFSARSVEPFASLFAAIEAGLPPSTTLVFTGGELSRRNTLLDRLSKTAGVIVEEFEELKGEALTRFIREEGATRGLRWRNGPFRQHQVYDEELARIGDPVLLLANIAKYETRPDSNDWKADTRGIINELDKLALYTMGGEVTVDTVFEVCSGDRHSTQFALSDSVMDGDLRKALDVLSLLLRDGVEQQAIIGFLATRYRGMATIIEMVEAGAAPAEIGAAMGRAGQFAGLRDRAIRRARRMGMPGLRAGLEAIVEADRTTKAGEVKDDGLALEVLVMRLCGFGLTPAR